MKIVAINNIRSLIRWREWGELPPYVGSLLLCLLLSIPHLTIVLPLVFVKAVGDAAEWVGEAYVVTLDPWRWWKRKHDEYRYRLHDKMERHRQARKA